MHLLTKAAFPINTIGTHKATSVNSGLRALTNFMLHQDSKSGIPHLHAAICRVDDEGNINNDSNIHLRPQRAAEKVAIKYGWQTAGEIRNKRNGIVEKIVLM